MSLEERVLAALEEKAASGGRLIEQFQAEGVDDGLRGRAVAVYGVLANLNAAGRIALAGSGPGEEVWGPVGGPSLPPRAPGFPPSFALGSSELEMVDREVGKMTRGVAPHFFEELRRVVVADADRRVFHGDKLPRAALRALDDLGPPSGVRRFLRRVERGGPVSLRISPLRVRWIVVPLVFIALLVAVRLFVLGVYSLPPDSASMEPTLVRERDRWILANLLAYRLGAPERDELAIFTVRGSAQRLVKRVVGLPGESIRFESGDLVVGDRRWVREREALDRVAVPLYGLADFAPASATQGYELEKPIHQGFAGSPRPEAAFDVVVRARLRPEKLPATVTLRVRERGRGGHTVTLSSDGSVAGVAVDGIEVAQGPDFFLRPGRTVDLWVTNADRLFRVEIDGVEVARAPIRRSPRRTELALVTENGPVAVEMLDVARDLFVEGETLTVPDDAVYLLGDNARNSRDSRVLGPVPLSSLVGRVFAVVGWPLEHSRFISK